jgi:hypothetical protein
VNWEAVGALGEWIGAFGVVISIVFLAQQVRSNTRALKARAAYDAGIGWAELNEELAQNILFDTNTPGSFNFPDDTIRLWQPDADPVPFHQPRCTRTRCSGDPIFRSWKPSTGC